MRNRIRRLLYLVVAAFLMVGSELTVFAQETPANMGTTYTTELNEYELAEQLATESPEVLAIDGFDSEEITAIKN